MRLIDADAYLKKACTYNETGCGSCKLQTICPVNEPTVDAVPVRHGEWIDSHDPWTGGICSACGYQTGERMGHLKLHYRYCHNCGARMDAEREEE